MHKGHAPHIKLHERGRRWRSHLLRRLLKTLEQVRGTEIRARMQSIGARIASCVNPADLRTHYVVPTRCEPGVHPGLTTTDTGAAAIKCAQMRPHGSSRTPCGAATRGTPRVCRAAQRRRSLHLARWTPPLMTLWSSSVTGRKEYFAPVRRTAYFATFRIRYSPETRPVKKGGGTGGGGGGGGFIRIQ